MQFGANGQTYETCYRTQANFLYDIKLVFMVAAGYCSAPGCSRLLKLIERHKPFDLMMGNFRIIATCLQPARCESCRAVCLRAGTAICLSADCQPAFFAMPGGLTATGFLPATPVSVKPGRTGLKPGQYLQLRKMMTDSCPF